LATLPVVANRRALCDFATLVSCILPLFSLQLKAEELFVL